MKMSKKDRSVVDLRMEVDEAKHCGFEKREPGMHPNELGYGCTRRKGHAGPHVAHDLDGSLIVRWS